ncbi:E3 ubiquitin-protein ligase RNF123-like [Hydractinia symbiolongicarpus]|uniref:E3 ubiquitin-protein ligase RNF123-like n=1 Tax=Hydractinia symbiolongicarpus TaxID=13093 RepID=UPI00255078BA|nr:E3 ubiquitin-protein ligase RNF123-like [Hydractinia symbiolongicarpus]
MATDQFLASIFPSKESDIPLASSRTELNFGNLQEHIKTLLSKSEVARKPVPEPEQRASEDGRIGGEIVIVDISSQCGTMNIGLERMELESQSNFSSIRANTCVCKGKWMYEVLLGSKGIMQLGWATIRCRFTNEEGVGDTADSYAYDGHRVRKWNMATGKYGEEWMAGDIIGCLIDMDAGTISYCRNGRMMGAAFEDIKRGSGYAYFPAVSLSYGEVIQMNFGATPFRYQYEDYKPLQDIPNVEILKTQELIAAFNRLLPPPSRRPNVPEPLTAKQESLTILTASHIFEQLGPMMMEQTCPYIVETFILPMLLESCNLEAPFDVQAGVKQLLELMWVCLEDFEIQPCMESLIWALVKGYWYGPVEPDYVKQLKHLIVALSLLRHDQSCKLWMSSGLFNKFPFMLHIRPPDDKGIKEAFPVVWWDGIQSTPKKTTPSNEEPMEASSESLVDANTSEMSIEEKQEGYLNSCMLIKGRITVLENIQVEMCKILMQMDDSSSKRDPRPCRIILAEKIRKILKELHMASSSLQPVQACSGPVMTCFLHRLIKAFKYHWDLWAKETAGAVSVDDVYIPHNIFYEESLNYFDLARVGGIISHLKKTHREDLKAARSSPVSRLASLSHHLDTSTPSSSSTPSSPTNTALDKTLIELLDSIALMYNTSVHRQLSKVHGVTETMREHSKALNDTLKKIQRCPPDRTDVLNELERAKRVFTKEATEVARHMGWVNSVIFSKEKQEDLHWLLRVVLRTIEKSQIARKLYVFMPEFYMENGIYLFQALWNYFLPLTSNGNVEGFEDTLSKMASFLASSLYDDRIVNPDVCDTIIQGVATFVCYPQTLTAIENITDEKKEKLMRCLMSAYDKRTWVHTTWILVRFWRGDGFGFRHATSPDLIPFGISDQAGTIRAFTQKPCPSNIYQQLMRTLCLDDQVLSNDFLNGVLNQLNWAFSEFVGILQEIQQATARFDGQLPETRQLRTCGICFDLTVGLLRVLEMVSSIVPEVFTDWSRSSAELTLTRLFQAVIQILNRVTASYKLFETLSRLHATDIERQDRYAVLAAVAGVLVTLLQRANTERRQFAVSKLLEEPSFQLESVAFLAGNPVEIGATNSTTPMFSFKKFKEVSQEECNEIEKLLQFLSEEHTAIKMKKQESIDAEVLCTICYALPQSVSFVPCGHSSCRSCITRHLMNSKDCFFCKEVVVKIKDHEEK